MKKMLVFLSLGLVLMLGLTSCGCQDSAAVDTTPPSASPTTGADYNANDNGTVDGDSNLSNGNNGMTGDMGTTQPGGTEDTPESTNPNGTSNGTNNGTNNSGTNNSTPNQNSNANGDSALDDVGNAVGDVGDAVDDLIDGARRRMR